MSEGHSDNSDEPLTAAAAPHLPSWEHFEHRADIGIRGYGRTPAEAFEQAALAMTAIITDLALIEAQQQVAISCEDGDRELLLVDWLNALVYEMATRRMLFSRFEVTLEEVSLKGRAWGEAIDVVRHHPAVEVKGATYTELALRRRGRCWMAQCVVDV
jgi:SHS2 domain-containing protein